MVEFAEWFSTTTGHATPRPWQAGLSAGVACRDRLIRIPTGMGKTEGVLATWLWHRVVRGDDAWPRRLVWCLPMRVLVEQTADAARRLVERSGADTVAVHTLMGGATRVDWHLQPECPAILVGTQDMLLSRALNRGYGAARGRWPIDFGLLNVDCLWVMDEVQLMDVGLTTSVQLQAFRDEDTQQVALRPAHTWWMSATLQPRWLETVESAAGLAELEASATRIAPDQRTDDLWGIEKSVALEVIPAADDKKVELFARRVIHTHQGLPDDGPRITLAIVNRVETSVLLHEAVEKALRRAAEIPELRLIHSRFRPAERRTWATDFLSKAASLEPSANRIIIATQVVEAGVDISAGALVTELAPWPSLVQRAGRVARYGGRGAVVVIDRRVEGKDALPYRTEELVASAKALGLATGVGLAALDDLETTTLGGDEVAALYVFEPAHVLVRAEIDELFDTSPDLSGADVDISRFIRTGNERDLQVWWSEVDPETKVPDKALQPGAEALCPVRVDLARDWLKAVPKLRAWVWDFVDDRWSPLRPNDDLYPGRVVLVDAKHGGYDLTRGFVGAKATTAVAVVPAALVSRAEEADAGLESDALSESAAWKTIATHGAEVAGEATRIAGVLGLSPDLRRVLDLAGRLHDWGKAHPVFQHDILRGAGAPERRDIAKFPTMRGPRDAAFRNPGAPVGPRRGFRHELATVLGVFDWLWQVHPDHDALLGAVSGLVEAGVIEREEPAVRLQADDAVSRSLVAIDAPTFDLLVYLLAAHHGKVRGTWQATPHDQAFPLFDTRFEGEGPPIRGVRAGDRIDPIDLAAPDGTTVTAPAVQCSLGLASIGVTGRYGRPWSERVLGLLDGWGPFALAYLESVLRAADVRATQLTTSDPRLADPEGGLS